jgi:hypothetical protein
MATSQMAASAAAVQPAGSQQMVAITTPVSPYQGGVNSAVYQYLVPALLSGNAYSTQQVYVPTAPPAATMTAMPAATPQYRSSPYASSYAPTYAPAAAPSHAPAAAPIILVSATQPDTRPASRAVAAARSTPVAQARMPQPREVEKPAEPVKPLSANQAHIKRLIEVACGDAAQDVELKALSENRLIIALRVRSAGEGQHLGQRILMMPELEPYKVDLAMEVKQ